MTVGSNSVTAPTVVAANAAAWEALVPVVTVNSVAINSAPVVSFTVTDAAGKPVVGLGNTTKSSTATLASYPNLAFSIAKLVPAASGSPSKWVSYIVTTVPTTTAAATPTRPSTDNTGTLVDNGDGTYKYTFYRDITTIKATVAGLTDPAGSNKADLGDLTYDASLTHRLTVVISGNAPGTGTNTPTAAASAFAAVPMKAPVNVTYDFIPATGKPVTATDTTRYIVANSKCEECHRVLGGIPGLSEEADASLFHGGNRNNVDYCVVCHSDQRKYGRTEATVASTNGAIKTFSGSTYVLSGRTVGNLPNFIHKVHLGGLLVNQSYNYGGVVLNETTYPQDNRNCTKCHDGSATSTAKTAQGDNWKNAPSMLACGACHDGINFATGTGVKLADANAGLTTSPNAHPAGPLSDNTTCALCHKPDLINTYHLPVTPPNSGNSLLLGGTNANTNAAWIASGGSVGRLPAGAISVTYDLKSVSRNASKQPVMVFRMLQNGTAVPLNTFATAAVNPATGDKELWDNFMGSPSVYFVFAVPQDGIAAPSDFNVSVSGWLKSLWNGRATGTGVGTLTGPDATGYYTATLTGVTVPDNAVMLTGGLGYTYSVSSALPLTQTNVAGYPTAVPTVVPAPTGAESKFFRTGGLIVIAPNKQLVAGAGCPVGANSDNAACVLADVTNGPKKGAYVGRRAIVEDARCNACHQELGTFTEDAFHAGQRNDGTTCSWCHRPNQTSSGWSADSTAFVHAIHAPAKRANQYTWHASSKTEGFWDVTYPGILNDCQTCHLPNTYNYGTSTGATPATNTDNRLFRTVGTGYYVGTVGNLIPAFTNTAGACVKPTAGLSAQTDVGVFALSPWVTKDGAIDGTTLVTSGTNYGVGFSYNAGLTAAAGCKPDGTPYSNPAGGTLVADPATLVTSPTVSVCSACHDSADALSHFKINGAAYYTPRSTSITGTNETCLVCHGAGRIGDIKAMHAKSLN